VRTQASSLEEDMTLDRSVAARRFRARAGAAAGAFAWALSAFLVAASAHANLSLSISAVDLAAESSGNSLEVLLTNTGGAAVEISAFTFELTSSTGAIRYTEANTDLVAAPYLFDGYSAFGPIISTKTGPTLDASDLFDDFSGGATVGPGAVVGLGHVLFDVVGAASGSSLEITLTGYPATSFSGTDASGMVVDFPFATLVRQPIIISSPVAEPGREYLTVVGLAGLGLVALRREKQGRRCGWGLILIGCA
jgi:hypothetical protein